MTEHLRIADTILCPPLVRTADTIHLPDCCTIRHAKRVHPWDYAEGKTLGAVFDALKGPGTLHICLRCDPLFLPEERQP